MNLDYIIFLSLRNLRGHKMRTFLTMGGVAISVGFIIFLVSLGLGLQKVSTSQIANMNALQIIDVTLGKSKILTITDDSLDKFKNLGNIEQVQPIVSLAMKYSIEGSSSEGIVYGANTDYLKLGDIRASGGKIFSSDNEKEAILNTAAANTNSNVIGKEVTITTVIKSELQEKDAKAKTLTEKYKIVGVVDDKNSAYIYIPLDVLREQGLTNYTGAKIKANSKDAVDIAKLKIENLGFKTTSIKDTVDQINQFFNIFQVILLSFGGIAVIVACMGMFNTLTISLLEKTREVGFMKALGTTRKDVYRLFVVESLLIGLLGSIFGILAGTALGWALDASILGLAKATGNTPVSLFYTPMSLILLVLTVSLVISFLTGFYPARRASRINPLDALRYE